MKITKFMKVTTLIAALGGATLISSCSNEQKDGNNPSPSVQDTLSIGSIGAVPTNNPMASFPLQVFNNTGKQMNLNSLTISLANGTKVTNAEEVAKYIDDSACKSIAAHGSCSLTIKNAKLVDEKGVGTSGTYALSLTASNGTSYTADQVVSYQHFAIDPKATNVVYSNIGGANKVSLKSANDRSGVTMPLYFPNAASVTLSAPANLGASLVGCGYAVGGVYHISAGSSCSITSSFPGGKNFSYPISLTQITAQKGLKSKKTNSLKVSGNPVVFVSSITNTIVAQAYLVAGASNSTILANGSTNLSLYFLNNGNATATSLNPSITYNGQTQNVTSGNITFGSGSSQVIFNIGSNNCNSSVNIGAYCTINLTVAAGMSNVFTTNVTYNGGLNSDAAYYTVYFYPVLPSPALQVTGGNFLNTVINTPATPVTQTFTVTNTGNATFAPLNVINIVGGAGAQVEAFSTSNNTCISPLAPNGVCSYQVTYNPTVAITASNNVAFQQPTTYMYNGQTITFIVANKPQYSAISNATDILFSVNNLQEATPLNTQTQKVVTLTNNSSADITNITFNFSQLLPSSAGISIGNNTCTGILSVGGTCAVQFIWAPTGSTEVAESGNILVAYNMNGTPSTGDVLPSNFVGTTSGINIIAESFVAVASTPSLLSGNGTQASPYLFYNTGDQVTFTLTYQNIGTSTASQVAVDTNMLPYGFTIVPSPSTTCGYGNTTSTLLPGDKCTLVFTGLASGITDGATASKTLNFTIPSVTNVDVTEDNQSYIANMLTLGDSSTIYVTSQPLIALLLTQGSPYQITDGSGHYMTQESMIFTSLLSNITGAPQVNVALGAINVGGVWNQNGIYNGNETLSISLNPSDSYSSQLVYANYKGSSSASSDYIANINATNVLPTVPYSINLNSPAVSAFYIASGNNVVTYQATAQGVTSIQIGGSQYLPFVPVQLVQSNGYLYAISPNTFGSGNDGVWSSAIVPRGTNFLPNIDTGMLINFVQNNNTTIGNTESINYLTFNPSGNTAYILDGSNNSYISCTANAGLLSACARVTLTGTAAVGALSSIAADNAGNIFVTQGLELYSCGTTTNCSSVTLPSSIITTTSNATLTGLVVVVNNNTVYVNQVLQQVVSGSISGSISNVPITSYVATASYNGSIVDGFGVNVGYGRGLQMATPAIVNLTYANNNQSLVSNAYYVLNASAVMQAYPSGYNYYSQLVGNPTLSSTGLIYPFSSGYMNQLLNNTSSPFASALYSFF